MLRTAMTYCAYNPAGLRDRLWLCRLSRACAAAAFAHREVLVDDRCKELPLEVSKHRRSGQRSTMSSPYFAPQQHHVALDGKYHKMSCSFLCCWRCADPVF